MIFVRLRKKNYYYFYIEFLNFEPIIELYIIELYIIELYIIELYIIELHISELHTTDIL